MPPKKRCSYKAQKGELLYAEPPKEGPVYHYGSPFHSADNPRCVPTKPVNQIGPSWIIPQFESATSVGFKRQRRKCPSFKNKDTIQVIGRCRRATAHKFPPLKFENVRTSPCAVKVSRCPVNCCGQTGSFAEMHPNQPIGTSAVFSTSPTRCSSGACMENCSQCCLPPYADPVAFSPPDICTLEYSSILEVHGGLPQVNSFTPGPHRSFVGNNNTYGGDASVLVRDTPEREYGVKVTWRRRSLLMKYLREKGVLSTSDTLVKTSMSAVPVEVGDRWR